MLAGESCDYLTMFEDRAVRRRIHQNTRNQNKAAIKRAQKDQLLRDRRASQSVVGSTFLGANGQSRRDNHAFGGLLAEGNKVRQYSETQELRENRKVSAARKFVKRNDSPFKPIAQ